MFGRLRNRIVAITMTVTTVVLVIAGVSVMFFSSTMRPEPRPLMSLVVVEGPADFSDQELKDFIKSDRKEGSDRLLMTLLCVGASVEVMVFVISYYLSERIVRPVEETYEKQKVFIANASHELKTPLAVIEANMEALEVEKGSEEWRENIETEITHANKLVLDLLQLAKMDAGGIAKSQAESIDLNVVMRERVEMFRPKFSGKIMLKKETEKTECVLPKQELLQVLDILLDNATKYGEKRITVRLRRDGVVVENDGTTIKEGDLEKIFDRFYQTDKTKEGSGLGLAIAKAICGQNGWEIKCASDEKTTKFSIRW